MVFAKLELLFERQRHDEWTIYRVDLALRPLLDSCQIDPVDRDYSGVIVVKQTVESARGLLGRADDLDVDPGKPEAIRTVRVGENDEPIQG
jgi:hypothetical protein